MIEAEVLGASSLQELPQVNDHNYWFSEQVLDVILW